MEVPFPPKRVGKLILFVMILGRKFCTFAMFIVEPEKAAE